MFVVIQLLLLQQKTQKDRILHMSSYKVSISLKIAFQQFFILYENFK